LTCVLKKFVRAEIIVFSLTLDFSGKTDKEKLGVIEEMWKALI
jgi:hypothetical protein